MAVSKEFHWTSKDGESIDVTFGAAGENVDIDGISLTEVLGGKADKQTSTGGFVAGSNASLSNDGYGGAAIGKDAQSVQGGGAVGEGAVGDNGGGVGNNAKGLYGGGAVGYYAKAVYGGAVGQYAQAGYGFAGGESAKCAPKGTSDFIDAIQLGTGTNSQEKTLQIYDYQMMDANGKIPLDRIGFTQYSETPVRVGTWIDGTPVWRVAIKHKFTEEELSSSGTMLTDRSWKIPYDEFLADKNGNSCTLLIDYKFILVSNIDYPCLIDDQMLDVSGGWFVDFPDGLPIQYFDGIMGWIEFATPESSLKTS